MTHTETKDELTDDACAIIIIKPRTAPGIKHRSAAEKKKKKNVSDLCPSNLDELLADRANLSPEL